MNFQLVKLEIEKAEENKILLDAPTLYESGADSLCNSVIAVLSSKENRRARILKRDGITEQAAELRLSAGKNDDYYKEKTQHIIYNDGTAAEFKDNFFKLLTSLEGK